MRIFLRIMLAAAVCCAGQRANAQLKSAPAAVSLSIPQARPIPDPADTLEIIVIGDVMMHSKQLQHDHRSFLREITPALRKADFAVANLEFPLAGEPYTGYPAFSTPDWYPAYVADCGVDVFLTANNHVLDQGSAGFARTLRVYGTMAAAGSATYTGSGPDEASFKALNPMILEKRGIKVALVNFCYGSNRGADALWPKMARMRKEEVHAQILRARQEGADFVVALPHWGDEYQLHPNTSQQEWARWLVEEGADAVVGSHPHVVQDTTHIGRVPVVYSLGNAVSNMSVRNTRLELAAVLRFVRCGSRPPLMLPLRLRWMWCTLPGKLTDSYATVFVDEWLGRRDLWKDPSDYDNMTESLERVRKITGIDK